MVSETSIDTSPFTTGLVRVVAGGKVGELVGAPVGETVGEAVGAGVGVDVGDRKSVV